MSPEFFNCIHSEGGLCTKYKHVCNGNTDALHCSEWRLIKSIDKLSTAIVANINLRMVNE